MNQTTGGFVLQSVDASVIRTLSACIYVSKFFFSNEQFPVHAKIQFIHFSCGRGISVRKLLLFTIFKLSFKN